MKKLTRRKFLKLLGITGAGVAASRIVKQEPSENIAVGMEHQDDTVEVDGGYHNDPDMLNDNIDEYHGSSSHATPSSARNFSIDYSRDAFELSWLYMRPPSLDVTITLECRDDGLDHVQPGEQRYSIKASVFDNMYTFKDAVCISKSTAEEANGLTHSEATLLAYESLYSLNDTGMAHPWFRVYDATWG